MRTLQPLLAALLLGGVFICSACGGGSGGSSAPPPPRNTPTPTPLPTFTQGPTPPPLCPSAQNPLQVPLALATPIGFPIVQGYCAQIEFPAGSSPVAGNTLTLATSIVFPPGYPPVIPPGAGNYAVGALPVAPWLTYSLSQTLFTNNQNPALRIIFPPGQPPTQFFYYVAVFDLTANPSQPFLTFPFGITPLRPRGGSPLHAAFAPAKRVRNRVSPNDVAGGHQFYYGLFAQKNGSNVVPGQSAINPSGGAFTLPQADQFSGSVAYGSNGAGSKDQMNLTSSDVDPTGGQVPPLGTTACSASPSGTPVFYESFLLSTVSAQIAFAATGGASSLSAASLVNGAAYTVCWFDVTATSSNPALLVGDSGALTAGAGVLSFPTLFTNAFLFGGEHTIVAEFVKD
jgi:hypothetical protein